MCDSMKSLPQPDCLCCGSKGAIRFKGLKDRLFGAPGEWNMLQCGNRNCGLLWLDPLPLEDEIHKAYQNFTTHVEISSQVPASRRILAAAKKGYLQLRFGYTKGVGPAWYKILSPLALLLPGGIAGLEYLSLFLSAPETGGRLLEIGCGNGQTLAGMRDMGWDVEGVDVDPVALELARNRGLTVHNGRLTDLNFGAELYDAVCMHHVIEHLHDPSGMVAECERILKPGGRLVIITPNTHCLSLSIFKKDWYPLDPPRHIFLYNLKNLKTFFEQAGLAVVKNCSISRAAKGYFVLSSDLKKKNTTDPYYQGTKSLRMCGVIYHIFQRLLILLLPYIGDELVVIGEKSNI